MDAEHPDIYASSYVITLSEAEKAVTQDLDSGNARKYISITALNKLMIASSEDPTQGSPWRLIHKHSVEESGTVRTTDGEELNIADTVRWVVEDFRAMQEGLLMAFCVADRYGLTEIRDDISKVRQVMQEGVNS